MWILFFFILLVTSNYVFLILLFRRGWKKLLAFSPQQTNQLFISVLIPMRNEESKLPNLLNQLLQQTYPSDQFEILFLNDHSCDHSVDLIEQRKSEFESLKILHLTSNHQGKKAAISEGIKASSGELIVTLDADCLPAATWLETIASFYQEHKPHVIIGPVIMNDHKKPLTRFISLEFTSLLASTAGAAGIQRPIMCNGANLAFKRTLINEIDNIYEAPFASGDDIFLLEASKKAGKSIRFCKSSDACVYTDPPQNIAEFINQRIRWASKSKYYTDRDLKYTAYTVFLFNTLIVCLLPASIFLSNLLPVFFALIFLKSLVDFLLLNPVIKFFSLQAQHHFLNYSTAQIIYPFYAVSTTILSQFSGYKWKNRIHHS